MIYHSHPLEGTGVPVYFSSPPSSRHSSPKPDLFMEGPLEPNLSFDTVHPLDECQDCHAYTKHVDQTFRSVSVHDKKGTFTDGIEVGRRLQLDEDSMHFSRYRGRLQTTRKHNEELLVSQHQSRQRVESLEAEIAVLRDRLIAMHMAYEDVARHVDGAHPMEWTFEAHSPGLASRSGSPHPLLTQIAVPDNANHTRFDEEAEKRRRENAGPAFIDDDDDDYSFVQQLHLMDERHLEGHFWADLGNGIACSGSESDGYDTTSSTSSSSLSLISASDTPPSETSDSDHHQETLLAPPLETELSINELSTLMDAAQEDGNTDALSEVKLLVQDAHRTPRKRRTAAQMYLLLTWRTPSWVSGSPRSTGPSQLASVPISPSQASTSLPRHPEIFVDASFYGIGLVFSEQWLAWRFAQRHPAIPIGPDRKVIMSWAELIAVELGVLTLIEAGYHDARVVIRSDNLGVVNALHERRWTAHYDLDGILRRIIRLCQNARLDLVVRWVSTKVNPADNPSRGVFPPLALAFPHAPVLPEHLRDILTQVTEI